VIRPIALCAAVGFVVAGCGRGTVTNDDVVSRRAAETAVERFFLAIHDGRDGAACAQLPDQQQAGLARLSAARGGPATCAGALRSLREFAPARSAGRLRFEHDIGFRSALPHKARSALDNVTVGGRELGSVGLRRTGGSWRIAIVCDCP
jgi:hypothetical protein